MWQEIKNIYHLGNAILANLWFGFPSRNLIVIGVTGTDGKTTTVSLVYHILHTAGYNVSMISSVGAIIHGKNYDVGFHVTTPSPWALQRFMKKAIYSVARGPVAPSSHPMSSVSARGGSLRALDGTPSSRATPRSNFFVLETTSHALDQRRVFGIKFAVGVLTNVTHEHLDYHKTYKNYVKTKSRLLKMARVAVVNRDDESYKIINSKFKTASFARQSRASAAKQNSKLQLKSQKFVTYGMDKNSEINPKNFPFKSKLIGEFNKYNVLAAVAACNGLGINDNDIRKGIESFTAPIGREEIVYKNDFTVMVDFAHTPNAFEQILSSIRPSIKGRLIHVFGAAGERDASKRPLMGKVSGKYSNVIVLTAEDPRSESVEKIMEEIALGIQKSKLPPSLGKAELRRPSKNQNYNSKVKSKDDRDAIFKIADRQEAIDAAIGMARKGDFVLITGKAHEKSMNYGKGEKPWDEFEAVRKALNKYV